MTGESNSPTRHACQLGPSGGELILGPRHPLRGHLPDAHRTMVENCVLACGYVAQSSSMGIYSGCRRNAAELWECLYLTDAEIVELLAFVQERSSDSWIYPAFVLVAHTGARRSEMMRARPDDVDLVGGAITIREKKRVKGRRTTRRVPLSTRLREALSSWMQQRDDGPVLFGRNGRMLSPQATQQGFERALKDSKWSNLRGWHVLRHSFISALASQGVDQRLIDDFVGHQTEEQRRRYRHVYPSTQQHAISSVFG